MYIVLATAVCVSVGGSVCLFVSVCLIPRRIPTLLRGPGCNLGNGIYGVPSSCAILGGFETGARVSLL